MSYAETPKDTVKRFSRSWDSTDHESLIAELISVAKETNREPDTYHFEVNIDGRIIDPNTKRPILEFITEGEEKDVARKLEEWASQNHEGMALWISPKKEGVYPCPKVIMHKIAYLPNGTKTVLNSVILFEAEIENPRYKRKTLYTLPDSEENIFRILSWINRKSKEEINTETTQKTSKERAIYYADQIQSGISHYQVIQEMQRSGFLGENSISCPGGSTFSGIVESNSSIFSIDAGGGKFVNNCGTCGMQINAFISSGYKCSSCGGTYLGC